MHCCFGEHELVCQADTGNNNCSFFFFFFCVLLKKSPGSSTSHHGSTSPRLPAVVCGPEAELADVPEPPSPLLTQSFDHPPTDVQPETLPHKQPEAVSPTSHGQPSSTQSPIVECGIVAERHPPPAQLSAGNSSFTSNDGTVDLGSSQTVSLSQAEQALKKGENCHF